MIRTGLFDQDEESCSGCGGDHRPDWPGCPRQGALEGAKARYGDPGTSHLAAAALRATERLGRLQRVVLSEIALNEGLTMGEYFDSAYRGGRARDKTTFTPRFKELEEAGLIERRGRRVNPRTGRLGDRWYVRT